MPGQETEWPWRPEDFGAPSTGGIDRIARLAARCFRGADGGALLAYLRALTLERALGPDTSDAALRHLEGQRQLVRHLNHLIELGRDRPDIPTTSEGHIA